MNSQLIASSAKPTVVGLGDTGLSCVRHFIAQGTSCAVVDSRENPPGLSDLRALSPDTPVSLGPLEASTLKAAGRLIVSPGVALTEPAVAAAIDAGVEVCGDIDLFCEAANAPVVGITGSNGKTTVTALLGEMLRAAGRRAAIGGNIGTPALDLLDDEVELYVLELSSFQLERAGHLGLALATVLNMSPDHMDRHGSMPAYHTAKHRIFLDCEAVVFNRDDPLSRPLQSYAVPHLSFGLGVPDRLGYGIKQHEGEAWIFREFTPVMPAAEVAMVGGHNVGNALAALALGELLEIEQSCMLQTLREFAGLPHRCQWIASINNVGYINDSKATNPGATIAALRGLSETGKLVLILGGQGKGADFTELCKLVATYCSGVVLLGEDAPLIEAQLPASLPRETVQNMEQAVARAAAMASPGSTVLLSPACASFDMFSGFAERGDVFACAVRSLGEVS